MLHSKNTEQLKADTERKGGWKAGSSYCLPRLPGGRVVPVLELLPAELQISSLVGKNLWDKAQTWSSPVLIQLQLLRVGVSKVA